MKIRDMQPGQTGKVTAFTGTDKAYRHKLLRMGLRKGVEFKLVRKAPMGDPVEVEINGSNLTLRKAEADVVDVEVVIGH
ncbi:FeoA family protein [Kiritimatiella glycovorans]|uniref:Ferrous iron transport protein A n=1 Tax=Kiritimatiella glycovorans TaxID=1307763 RepID=A0A0G3EHH9_9BACT|nr:FeoA family protein [Kiritimatiella glycovorans]AKJ64852.1 Ferrous iron transport protein A [Kiritimatiella glycovorans]